ncbi:MAG: TetR/AcrR family transcriptional regulator [Myxococcota bacterium]
MSSPSPPDPRRRAPRQARSRVLVESLLEATRRILDEEGSEALTTNRIADVAGVSIGSLYQYFEDKEGLVDAIFLAEEERNLEQRVRWASEALELPLEEMFRFFIERIVAQHRRLLAMHAGLYHEHRKRTDMRILGDARMPPHPSGPHVVELFLQAWCQRHREEVRPENLEHAAFLVDRVGYAMIRETVDERPGYLEDPRFVDEMVELLVAYLRK